MNEQIDPRERRETSTGKEMPYGQRFQPGNPGFQAI